MKKELIILLCSFAGSLLAFLLFSGCKKETGAPQTSIQRHYFYVVEHTKSGDSATSNIVATN